MGENIRAHAELQVRGCAVCVCVCVCAIGAYLFCCGFFVRLSNVLYAWHFVSSLVVIVSHPRPLPLQELIDLPLKEAEVFELMGRVCDALDMPEVFISHLLHAVTSVLCHGVLLWRWFCCAHSRGVCL